MVKLALLCFTALISCSVIFGSYPSFPRCPELTSAEFKLWTAAKEGNIEHVKQYLTNGTSPLWQYPCHNQIWSPTRSITPIPTALHVASKFNQTDVVKILLDSGVDVDLTSYNNMTALHTASQYGQPAIATILIHNGSEVNRIDWFDHTPLFKASIHGHTNMVTLLIANGADRPTTALHHASANGKTDTVNILINNGADVNAVDVRRWQPGQTPLHLALAQGHTDTVKSLIKYGADVNAVDVWRGKTPLQLASTWGRTDIAKHLIDNGAEVNAVHTRSGQTPLHMAAHRKNTNTVSMLLDNGADPNKRDRSRKTAGDIARKNGYVHLANILDSYISVTDRATSPTPATNVKHYIVLT